MSTTQNPSTNPTDPTSDDEEVQTSIVEGTQDAQTQKQEGGAAPTAIENQTADPADPSIPASSAPSQIESSLRSTQTQSDPSRTAAGSGILGDADAAAIESAEARIAQKKEMTLREFLGKMDDYAPIIPDALTAHYLTLAGLPPPPTTPLPLARLLALATQKFIADIAADAYQYARIRQGHSGSGASGAAGLGGIGGAGMPGGLLGGAGAGAGGVGGAGASGAPGGAGGAPGGAKQNTLGTARPGFGGTSGSGGGRAGAGGGGAGAGGSSGVGGGLGGGGSGPGGAGGGGTGVRTVLTMEDLGMAVGEYGVNVRRGDFYR